MGGKLDDFSAFINSQVQTRLVRAQELVQDARLIEVAWADFDVDTLVALGVINATQARELRALFQVV